MTISEIAAELRVALGNCVDAKEGSVEERIFHLLAECFRRRDRRTLVIAFLFEGPSLSLSSGQKEANDFSEWMALSWYGIPSRRRQLTGSKDLTRATGHRATVRPDDRKRPVYARPTVHSDGNTGLDDKIC
jgi:hypothetical protein